MKIASGLEQIVTEGIGSKGLTRADKKRGWIAEVGPRPRRKLGNKLGTRLQAHIASRQTLRSVGAKIAGEGIES